MARPSKDEKLIKENPKLTPYQLLEKGLSEKKYEELLAEANKPKPEPKNLKEAEKMEVKQPEKLIPEIKPSMRAQPILQPHVGIVSTNAKVKAPNGKVTSMDRKRAIKFVKKNPNYKLID